jgi:hypothetical protein
MEKRSNFVHVIPRQLVKDFTSAQLVRAHQRWDKLVTEKNEEQVSLFKAGFRPEKEVRAEYRIIVDGSIFNMAASLMSRQQPPASAEFLLFMVSRERRHDVMADLDDWYSSWCVKFGPRRAKFLCWWRVGCCVGGAVLEVLGRVGEFISKVAPK